MYLIVLFTEFTLLHSMHFDCSLSGIFIWNMRLNITNISLWKLASRWIPAWDEYTAVCYVGHMKACEKTKIHTKALLLKTAFSHKKDLAILCANQTKEKTYIISTRSASYFLIVNSRSMAWIFKAHKYSWIHILNIKCSKYGNLCSWYMLYWGWDLTLTLLCQYLFSLKYERYFFEQVKKNNGEKNNISANYNSGHEKSQMHSGGLY